MSEFKQELHTWKQQYAELSKQIREARSLTKQEYIIAGKAVRACLVSVKGNNPWYVATIPEKFEALDALSNATTHLNNLRNLRATARDMLAARKRMKQQSREWHNLKILDTRTGEKL